MSSKKPSSMSIKAPASNREVKESASPEPVEEMVFSELVEIRDQLKAQLSSLAERESALRKREDRMRELEELVARTQEQLSLCIDQEVARRTEVYQCEVERLEEALQQKAQANQRLRNSFETVRLANKNLKQQLDDVRVQNEQLESQLTSMQGRLRSLQRKMQHTDITKASSHPLQARKTACTQTSLSVAQSTPSCTTTSNELLALLMTAAAGGQSGQSTQERLQVRKLLQLSCQLLPTLGPGLELPCVQFLYHLLLQASKHEKSQLTSTLRRIGEHLYQPKAPAVFYKSPDPAIRTFSILIILVTTTQVDVICEVLYKLKEELNENGQSRELFLSSYGVEQLVHLTHPVNKVTVALVVDIFLQLSIESALLPRFLQACATEEWFSMAALLLSHHLTIELHTLEKLSILLQRLSKLKNCRRHFEGCKMPSLLQKLLAKDGLQAQAPFLALNLQSTLMNLIT